MKTDNLKINIRDFIAWRSAASYRAHVKTRAQMLAFCGKGQTNHHGNVYVHETGDFAPIVWDSKTDSGRNATGYYSDNFQTECVYWCVVKIAPANRKRNRGALYVPATYFDVFEGATIHVDRAGSLDDAKRWGEQIAESEAEECRRYDMEFQAEQQIEDARAEIHAINQKVIPCLRELRTVSLSSGICTVLREKIMDYLNERDSLFARIETLTANPWEAVK